MSTPDAKRAKSQASRDLTEDVTREILLKLPLESLVRFKCVCKQWYAIIESQSFIEQHFGQRSNKERLLVRYYNLNVDRHAYALFVDDICSGFEEPAHLQMPNRISQLLGPVNGVFCLVGEPSNLALLNPATRQLKPLPKLPEVFVETRIHYHKSVLGFGLVPLSGDYKVVSIRYVWDERLYASDCRPIVYIYNLCSDSWRELKDVGCCKSKYAANRSYCKGYLNGVYYWTMGPTYLNVSAVLAFDMTTEQFQEIEVPDCLTTKYGHLTIHNNSIALLSYELPGTDCEVWVMEKAGSWNKVAVIGLYQPMDRPLSLWKDDELLIETNTSLLLLCNICTRNRQLTQARLKVDSSFSYKESLVSVKRGRDNCLVWDASPHVLTVAWS